MPITTNVVSSNPAQAICTRYNIVIKVVSDLRQVVVLFGYILGQQLLRPLISLISHIFIDLYTVCVNGSNCQSRHVKLQ